MEVLSHDRRDEGWWGVAEFVQEYAALRWAVVAAFLVASAIVVLRLAGSVVGRAQSVAHCSDAAGPGAALLGSPALTAPISSANQLPVQDLSPRTRAAHQESDAAHLVMCLIMLVMLIFPTGASPHAVRGVLIAVMVAFGALLVSRIVEWRAARAEVAAGHVFAIGYHALAAAAMLYAMSGHSAAGHTGPAPLAAFALAALFLADAGAVLWLRGGGWHRLTHPVGGGSAAVAPHVVMDLGTAYMLIAAVLGGNAVLG
ncbi:DUF5134 domain-containing protein [Nocardia lijiangensis]|uniref:DUF5134 domain-containing protein n=1 Tax=Nocardia lijiangensis TaxID=299618 RepID=UPI000832ECC2|nr:DUF5134 domain-containing protein [Nocardia lijiangensis]